MVSSRGQIRLLVAVVAVFGVVSLSVRAAGAPDQPVTISGFDREQALVIESALARYEAADLELPRVHVRHSKGGGECTRRGRAAETWPVILMEVCVVKEEVVLHELAHVWAFGHLDSTDRRAWNERRGTPTWRSRDHQWHARGAEHAADILTWYLFWSEDADGHGRIGGELGSDRFLSDVEWLLQAGGASGALMVYSERAPEIILAANEMTS